jgi:hypothetical protein
MKLGFSLSPGGLLLPYHMGALQCLEYERFLEPHQSIVAGSSAGSIAAMAYGCGISPQRALEGTIEISDRCATMGRAQGKLLPLLEEQMESLVGEQEFAYLLGGGGGRGGESDRNRSSVMMNTVDGNFDNFDHDVNHHDDDIDVALPDVSTTTTNIGIAYTQIFPQRKGYLQRSFVNRNDLFRAVRFSCMFPFFTTPWPCLVDTDRTKRWIPRLMVDGYFSVPRDQFGCHFLCDKTTTSSTSTITTALDYTNINDLIVGTDQTGKNRNRIRQRPSSSTSSSSSNPTLADRTIAISCFPQDVIGMTAFSPDNCISPALSSITSEETTNQMGSTSVSNLFRVATQPTSRKELTDIFELGYQNAEVWCRNEVTRLAKQQQQQRQADR